VKQEGTLSVRDVIAIVVGIVIGVGIFRTPSLVAANAGSAGLLILIWILGGIISLNGSLCYAELATAYPHPGGDYHYMARAFGKNVAFLFAWARMTVIQTGSIAMLAFIFGDYLTGLLPVARSASPFFASFAVLFLTAINLLGMRQGKRAQAVLTLAKVLGLLAVIIPGLLYTGPVQGSPMGSPSANMLGLAMIFVLLTYGGWNEAAYVSADLKHVRRGMVPALLWSLAIITAVYVGANLAFLRVLGLSGMSASEHVAADFANRLFGQNAARLLSLLICISALGSINGSIVTGARTNFALGMDQRLFRALARWRESAATPPNALLAQCAMSLLLVLFGAVTRQGFVSMVEYTAPVFWGFFFLGALSLIALRIKEPDVERPFTVPFYPFTPILFCATCLYMLRASIAYTGKGALVGLAVLFCGLILILIDHLTRPRKSEAS
jgi:basic amino acid/polyamine antiporter, APA family